MNYLTRVDRLASGIGLTMYPVAAALPIVTSAPLSDRYPDTRMGLPTGRFSEDAKLTRARRSDEAGPGNDEEVFGSAYTAKPYQIDFSFGETLSPGDWKLTSINESEGAPNQEAAIELEEFAGSNFRGVESDTLPEPDDSGVLWVFVAAACGLSLMKRDR